jgi:hypothetical protein
MFTFDLLILLQWFMETCSLVHFPDLVPRNNKNARSVGLNLHIK